jgi:micrococcal nuclease
MAGPVLDRIAADPQDGSGTVLEVFDGDTLLVRVDGKEEKVRLLGIDTPELARDDRPVQPLAGEATTFTDRLARGRTVRLEPDPASDDRDRYGRLLRYVRLPDGADLSAELIRKGLGIAFTSFPFSRADQYVELEAAARKAGTGLWASDQVRLVSWEEAPGYTGSIVRTSGRIVAEHDTGGICFLNFHEDYREHLSLVILEADRHRFDPKPADLYLDRTVGVIGRVTEYRGRPRILMSHPSQIEPVGSR